MLAPKILRPVVAGALVALGVSACTPTDSTDVDFSFDHFRGAVVGEDWADAAPSFGDHLTGGGSCGATEWRVEGGANDPDLRWYVMVEEHDPSAGGDPDHSGGTIESFSVRAILTEDMQDALAYDDPGFALDGDYWSEAPTTTGGVRLGSSADDVLDAFPEAADMSLPEDYSGGSRGLEATDGQGNTLRFLLYDDVVLEITGGSIEALDAPYEPWCDKERVTDPGADFSHDRFRGLTVGSSLDELLATFDASAQDPAAGADPALSCWLVESNPRYVVVAEVRHPVVDGEVDPTTGTVELFSLTGILTDEMDALASRGAWTDWYVPGYWDDTPVDDGGLGLGPSAGFTDDRYFISQGSDDRPGYGSLALTETFDDVFEEAYLYPYAGDTVVMRIQWGLTSAYETDLDACA